MTKSDQNIHQNAPNYKNFNNFLGGVCPQPPSKEHGAKCKFMNLKKFGVPRQILATPP